jgi:hypothetical protein
MGAIRNFQTVSELDFSHLSQTGGCRSAPIRSKRDQLEAAKHPAYPIWATKLAAARKGQSVAPSPVARVG